MSDLEYQRPWLYPKQAEALFNDARYSIVEASTKSGKTVGCMAWIFEQAALNGRPGRNYWWIAPTLPTAKIAYRRLKRGIPRDLYKANDSDVTLTLCNGAVIWFKGADRPDSLYGEDVFAAVIDEASRCKAEAWWAVRSTLTATRGPIRIIGNVKGKKNWAYQLARRAEAKGVDRKRMQYFMLTAYDAAEAGVLSEEEVADAKDTLPPDVFKELYLNIPTDSGQNPFGLQAIKDCTQIPLETGPERIGEPVAWGWDFGRAVDYTVGTALDRYYQTVKHHSWRRPWGETKKDVTTLTGATPAWGDSTGIGDVIIEDLQTMGCPIIGYHFNQKSRQMLMQRLQTKIHERGVRFPPSTAAQLEEFEYVYTSAGVKYMCDEGLHDDEVMSLALAIYGRDQFGEIVDPPKKVWVADDTHPGVDWATGERLPTGRVFDYEQTSRYIQSAKTVPVDDIGEL